MWWHALVNVLTDTSGLVVWMKIETFTGSQKLVKKKEERNRVVLTGNVKCSTLLLSQRRWRGCLQNQRAILWLTVGARGIFALYNLTINIWIWNWQNTFKWQLGINQKPSASLLILHTYVLLVRWRLLWVHWDRPWNRKNITGIKKFSKSTTTPKKGWYEIKHSLFGDFR